MLKITRLVPSFFISASSYSTTGRTMGNHSVCCSADHVSMHMPQSPLASILFSREWHHVAIAIADYLRVRDLCVLVEVCRLALASDLPDELLRRAVIFVRPLKRGQGVSCSMFRGSSRARLRAFKFTEWVDVATVQAAFPNLDRICIGYEFIMQEGESLDLNKSHRLTRLDLAMRFKTDPALLASLPHLEHLTIRRLSNASLLCRLASLQHLVLDGSGINSIDFVWRMPRLEHLSLCEATSWWIYLHWDAWVRVIV